MGAHTFRVEARSRFSGILDEKGVRPIPYADEILIDGGDWVVTPTLGSIVAGWILLIPRADVLNFWQWERECEGAAHAALSSVEQHIRNKVDNYLWFEHGPQRSNSLVGCGVDHAHLHLLFNCRFSAWALVQRASFAGLIKFHEVRRSDLYGAIPDGRSYLVVGDADRCWVSLGVDGVGSQFLRRQVAALVGEQDRWDYKQFPFLENARETSRIFGTLHSN